MNELPQCPQIEGVEIRHCPGRPGYAVGTDGSVWSCRIRNGTGKAWRRLNTRPNATGHLFFDPCISGRQPKAYVHRLVLEAFVGPCPSGMEACHAPDNNPANCRLDNLRWDTHKHNEADKIAAGTSNDGERCGVSRLTEDAAVGLIIARQSGLGIRELRARFGISDTCTRNLLKGLTWKRSQKVQVVLAHYRNSLQRPGNIALG